MAIQRENRVTPARDRGRQYGAARDHVSRTSRESIVRYFRDNFPVLLDGALPERLPDGTGLVRQARASLARDPVEALRMPAEALRQILDNLVSTPCSATKAGLVAVGPHHARVWWDESVVDNLDDVLMQLDSPRLVLRFYDVTGLNPDSGRWHAVIEMDVALHERGRTVELFTADRSYVVDLGYTYADGRFLRLARTGLADLPRDGSGPGDPTATSRSRLVPRNRPAEAAATVDSAALAWVESRLVEGQRDSRTELFLHLVYRAFLREGPRALRRLPRLDYQKEGTVGSSAPSVAIAGRMRSLPKGAAETAGAGFLVARLDIEQPPVMEAMSCPPVPIAVAESTVWRQPRDAGGGYRWMRSLLAISRLGIVPKSQAVAALIHANSTILSQEKGRVGSLVQPAREVADDPAFVATSVFAAAEHLRRNLAGLNQVALSRADATPDRKEKAGLRAMVGGGQAKRMAKAGVNISRMTLTLEGRMRPGARLKVGGRLVHADGQGRFRLECILSGRKTSIPMRAGVSVGGEARSLIHVEWEKRSSKEKRHVR